MAAFAITKAVPLFDINYTRGQECVYFVPDGVVTICSMAFGACQLFVTLIIPRSVRFIGDFVFSPEGGKIVIRD